MRLVGVLLPIVRPICVLYLKFFGLTNSSVCVDERLLRFFLRVYRGFFFILVLFRVGAWMDRAVVYLSLQWGVGGRLLFVELYRQSLVLSLGAFGPGVYRRATCGVLYLYYYLRSRFVPFRLVFLLGPRVWVCTYAGSQGHANLAMLPRLVVV